MEDQGDKLNTHDQAEPTARLRRYKMDSPHKAKFVIFAIDEGHLLGVRNQRKGTLKDIDNLRRVFTKLGFEVKDHLNPNAEAIVNILSSYAEKDWSNHDCFACCITAHGTIVHDEEFVVAADGQRVLLPTLFTIIDNCKSLQGKPKLFFINTCRRVRHGEESQKESYPRRCVEDPYHMQVRQRNRSHQNLSAVQSVNEDFTHVLVLNNKPIPPGYAATLSSESSSTEKLELDPREASSNKQCDMLKAFSSSVGSTSFRSVTGGSFYIEQLCETVEELYQRADLLTILREVNKRVSDKVTTEKLEEETEQITLPEPESTLQAELYFHDNW